MQFCYETAQIIDHMIIIEPIYLLTQVSGLNNI